jgi:hypothetical protein
MKKNFPVFMLLLICSSCFAQKTLNWPNDTVKVTKVTVKNKVTTDSLTGLNTVRGNPDIDSIQGLNVVRGNPNIDSISGGTTIDSMKIGNTGYMTGDWIDYYASSTVTGWASFTIQEIKYIRIGNSVSVEFCIYGTSNSTSCSFALPIKASSDKPLYACYCSDSITIASSYAIPPLGYITFHTDSLTVRASNLYGPTWQNHGSKNISGSFTYMAKK